MFSEVFNLAEYFLYDRLKEGFGADPAIRFGTRSWTYADVAGRTTGFAEVMRAAGLRNEERVLTVLPDLPPFAWSFFATLRAGGVVAMGNPDAPAEDLAYLLEYTRAAVLVTIPRVLDALRSQLAASPWIRAVYVVPDAATGDDPETAVTFTAPDGVRCEGLAEAIGGVGAGAAAEHLATVRTKRDDVAVWLFTSGSTGKPKAAVHTHRDFAFNTEVYALGTVGYRRGDVCVSVPRLFFGYATGTNLMFPFRVGATVGMFSERPTVESLTRAIATYRPTVLTNVPTMIGKLLESPATLDLSSLRFCLSAGEALPPSLLARWTERFGIDVYDGIGSAEMFHIYVSNRPGDIKPGSLGRVVDGYALKVLPRDAEGPGAAEVATNEVGVLWVAGDSVALCYQGDRDKSWKTFHGRWCCTGDLFRVDADGYLWFGGRADELLKVSGLWVSPLEVEDCLRGHPAVADVAVIGVDVGGLVQSRAVVVVRAGYVGSTGLASELQQWAKDRLAKHKYPRQVVFADDLPKNDRGKVDRKALRA